MKEPIPVNPAMLRWARETMHLSVDEVAQRIGKKAETVASWENSSDSPTYVQLETLARTIYNRPLALFFFPKPPEEEGIKHSFRTLPEHELSLIPPRVCYLLRKAKVLQMNLVELFENSNPSNRQILNDLHFQSSASATDMAEQVRRYLGIELAQQQSWRSTEGALKNWRNALESCGIFVFKDTFNSPGQKSATAQVKHFSGFCLFDEKFPIIYINNNTPKSRQIFTLFHELAHLLMQTGGVDTSEDDYINRLAGESRRIEILCNQFAAEFLVPSRDFERHLTGISPDDGVISKLADSYSVSRETILRKLLDHGVVDRQYYETKVEEWYTNFSEVKTGGNYYLNLGVYLGGLYIRKVFSLHHQERISIEQAADYLGTKTRNVAGMEEWVFKHGMAM